MFKQLMHCLKEKSEHIANKIKIYYLKSAICNSCVKTI